MGSNEIQCKQNDEKLLKIQYAAREYYNSAEKLNHFTWLLCLVSAFSVFLPSSCPKLVLYAIPFTTDIMALIFTLLVNHRVSVAAKLRKYFDAYVLDICPNQFTEIELREIKEAAENVFSRNSQKAIIQMANTDKDLPRGVHEWYVFSKAYTGISAQFECQCQNIFWNSKLFLKRLVASIGAFILVGICFILLLIHYDVILILLCSSGIIIKIIERLIANWQYISISKEIVGSQKTVEKRLTKEGIKELQTLIDKRRAINVLEINWFHKKNAKQISKLYENISK